MKVAAVQFDPQLYQKERNLTVLRRLVEDAFHRGASIVVAPEMATTGYCFYDRADVARFVEPIPGPTTEALTALCAQYGGIAVVGMAEVDAATSAYYNAVAVVGPQGVLGRYRKIHSFISEPRWAMDGDLGPTVVRTPFGALGILDCSDIEYFEAARTLQIMGADLIVFPTNWCGDPAPSAIWWARAKELGLPLVAADRIGTERGVVFSGGSTIFDACGEILARIDSGEGVAVADVPLRGVAHSKTSPLAPEDYLPMTRSSHLFEPTQFFNLYGREDLPKGSTLQVSALPIRGTWQEIERALLEERGGLVVLPQDAVTEPDGDLDAKATELCRRRKIFLAFGTAFGAQITLYGPEGLLLRQQVDAQPGGARGAITNIEGVRVGLCSGGLLAWPETSRLFAMEGVDLIAAPDRGTALRPRSYPGSAVRLEGGATPPDPNYFFLPRVRACTDDLYVAYASADIPCALLAAFTGAGVVDLAGARGTVVTDPTKGALDVRTKPHLRARRPDQYAALWSARR